MASISMKEIWREERKGKQHNYILTLKISLKIRRKNESDEIYEQYQNSSGLNKNHVWLLGNTVV